MTDECEHRQLRRQCPLCKRDYMVYHLQQWRAYRLACEEDARAERKHQSGLSRWANSDDAARKEVGERVGKRADRPQTDQYGDTNGR